MHVDPNDPNLLLLDPDAETRLMALTSATGWFACYRTDERWAFLPIPLFATMVHKPVTDAGLPELRTFGLIEFLGQLERVDVGNHFMGYVHESEFEIVGAKLRESVIARLEDGEWMCGDPERFLP